MRLDIIFVSFSDFDETATDGESMEEIFNAQEARIDKGMDTLEPRRIKEKDVH